MERERERVVITGVGVITPIGIGKESFWDALINGESGIRQINCFDTSEYKVHTGGEIPDFIPERFMDEKKVNRLDRACQLGIAAANLAVKDSGLDLANLEKDKYKIGVIMGTTSGTNKTLEDEDLLKVWLESGISGIDPQRIARYAHQSIPNSIACEFGVKGFSGLIGTACAAGTYAVGESFDLIRSGRAEIMITGGSDSMSLLNFSGFHSTRSLAKGLCKPFDKNRDGLTVSEGSGVLILESIEHAMRRDAHIYAEVVGFGLSCDALHMTAPDITGKGAAAAMRMALKDAQMEPKDIDYINAHGTGTFLNDKMETKGIKEVFRESAYEIPISSIKSMIGHTMGAAGAIEAVTCALTLENDIIPPTVTYQESDFECDLDYVSKYARRKKLKNVLSTSFAFGGNNATIILKKGACRE